MKKYLFLILTILLVVSCEKDNICIDETTPHLVIRFYDKLNPTKLLKVTNLKVEVANFSDELIQIGDVVSTDSIALPLNVDMDLTKIYLTKNVNDTSTGIQDSFILNYNREEVFVSRSCGYKTIYNNISTSDLTSNWIENVALVNVNILNEEAAHITIFH